MFLTNERKEEEQSEMVQTKADRKIQSIGIDLNQTELIIDPEKLGLLDSQYMYNSISFDKSGKDKIQ